MGIVSVASGLQPATLDTEHSLSQQTGVGIYVLVVDTAELAGGDTVEVRVKTRCVASGTVKTAYLDTYTDAQPEPHKYSVPVPIDHEIICTIKQTLGVARTFPWNLLRA